MKLHAAVEQYIGLKTSLGFRFRADSVILRAFRRAMGCVKLGDVKPTRVRAYLDGTGPLTRFWERKWVTLRGFYRFAQARGLVRQSPWPKVPPKPPPPFVPYIYSRAELRRLLAAVPAEPIAGLTPATLRTLLLLLYGAGLRLSEALNLNEAQVDLEACLLTICQSKFFKTRWVPISPQLAQFLARYRAPHPHRVGNRGRPFFRSVTGEPVRRSAAERAFRTLRQAARVQRSDGARYQPRLHDLRHTFAVHRLLAGYRQGADVQSLLPALATYLGHMDVAATQHYLTLSPELSRHASRRFEEYAFPGGSHE
jgi:integrase